MLEIKRSDIHFAPLPPFHIVGGDLHRCDGDLTAKAGTLHFPGVRFQQLRE
jgi:hypothetical protein